MKYFKIQNFIQTVRSVQSLDCDGDIRTRTFLNIRGCLISVTCVRIQYTSKYTNILYFRLFSGKIINIDFHKNFIGFFAITILLHSYGCSKNTNYHLLTDHTKAIIPRKLKVVRCFPLSWKFSL